jgi:Ca-activated chloride channel family protein
VLVVALGLQSRAGLAQDQAEDQAPSFRAAVDLVSLNITVMNGKGQYITDVNAGEFQVFEDGVYQDLTLFNRTDLPIALSLLLDTSSSMEDRLGTAQEAAVGFANQLRPQDLAEVVDFDSRVEVLQTYTSDREELERAIRRTIAGGSTSLYNAVYIALKGFQKVRSTPTQADEIRRQAIVLLSDGEDTSSLVFREATFALRQLASQTGGRVFFIDDIDELAGVYGQISDELSSQYTVGYVSKNPRRDGSWRRIIVQVDRPKLAVRTKQGYYAPTR